MSRDENKEKVTVHVKLFAKPGQTENLVNAIADFYEETRKEPGCEYTEVLQNIDNSSLITLVEKFTSYAAFKKHMQMPLLRNFIDNLAEKLTAKIDVSFYMTRVDCNGDRGDPLVEELSFREDLRDR